MRRGPRPAKSKVPAKRPVVRKSPKDDDALEKRLAEALEQLQTRDRELAEAQQRQAATSEILRVISSSPTDPREAPANRAGCLLQGVRGEKIQEPHPGRKRIEAFVASGGAYVYGSYADIDGLFGEQAGEMDPKRRAAILERIQQLIHDKAMFAPIWEIGGIGGVGPRVGEPVDHDLERLGAGSTFTFTIPVRYGE